MERHNAGGSIISPARLSSDLKREGSRTCVLYTAVFKVMILRHYLWLGKVDFQYQILFVVGGGDFVTL